MSALVGMGSRAAAGYVLKKLRERRAAKTGQNRIDRVRPGVQGGKIKTMPSKEGIKREPQPRPETRPMPKPTKPAKQQVKGTGTYREAGQEAVDSIRKRKATRRETMRELFKDQ